MWNSSKASLLEIVVRFVCETLSAMQAGRLAVVITVVYSVLQMTRRTGCALCGFTSKMKVQNLRHRRPFPISPSPTSPFISPPPHRGPSSNTDSVSWEQVFLVTTGEPNGSLSFTSCWWRLWPWENKLELVGPDLVICFWILKTV